MPVQDRLSSIRQETLTVLAKVEREAQVRDAMASTRPEIFAPADLGIHFARLVMIPRDEDIDGSSAWLAFESNFDTPAADAGGASRAHLELLATRLGDHLGAAFAGCEGLASSPVAAVTPEALAAYWKERLAAPTASYQGHANRDLARIRLEQHLREVILTFLETADRCAPEELFERIRKHVRAEAKRDPRLGGLDVDAPAPPLPDPDLRSRHLREDWEPWLRASSVMDSLPIVARLPQAILEWQRHDVVYDVRGHQERSSADERRAVLEIAATEDYGTQNALTHVVPLRQGPGREAVLKHAHAIVDRISKEHFVHIGQLGRIPSIHFAKWVLFEGDRRLLFLSNYDKSWESYLGDFIDKAPEGLNLAWSCTKEYPHTFAFAFDGAKDEETFKAWTRAYQVPTQVFYSAYTDLTIEAINNNTWIRHRLHGPADAGGLEAWLRRLT